MSDRHATNYHLIASCPDQSGIVAKVSSFIAERGATITEAGQYEDANSQTFFMRYAIAAPSNAFSHDRFSKEFADVADVLDMEWQLVDASQKRRVVILVSKFDHCLAYLLHRRKVGDLSFDLPCIISNHEALRELVEWYGVPFHFIPISKEEKQVGFDRVADCINDANPDTIVLARYMQILPPSLCQRYRNRVINIHHSFLPSFVGAKPYRQAKERGVKLIGATCHYVTEQLDEGPIIEQDVTRVKHNDTIKDMMRLGKDIENSVLARGLRFHLEDRVIVHSNKCIVFV